MITILERTDNVLRWQDALNFDYVRGDKTLIDAVADEWESLCNGHGYHQPFFRPSLALAYVDSFAADSPVVLVTARQDGRLVAILPMVERTIGTGGRGLRWLHSTANTHFVRFDVVHAGLDPERLATALWRFLSARSDWDVIQIDSAPAGGVADHMRQVAARHGGRSEWHRPDRSPFLTLDRRLHGSVEEIIRTRPRNLRAQLRRAIRRASRHGAPRLIGIGPEHGYRELLGNLEEFYTLEHAGWKGRAGTSVSSDPETRMFYDRLAVEAMHRGELQFFRLEVGGELLAMRMGLAVERTYMSLKVAHNEAYLDCSPGHLLNLFVLPELVRRGFGELDLCGTADPHKLAWTDTARPFGSVFLSRPGLRGWLAWSAMFRVAPKIRRRLGDRQLPAPVRRMTQ